MDDDLQAGRFECDRVQGAMDLSNHGIAGGDHLAPERVNGEPVTRQALGEDRVGNVLEGDDDA